MASLPVGLQATSLTQSVWPAKGAPSSLYDCDAVSKDQMRTRLSDPPVTKRRRPCDPPDEETSDPGVVEGAQETEFTPSPWAGKIL